MAETISEAVPITGCSLAARTLMGLRWLPDRGFDGFLGKLFPHPGAS